MATQLPAGASGFGQSHPTAMDKRWPRRLVSVALALAALLFFSYGAITTYMAPLIVRQTPLAIDQTPATYQLDYRNVAFAARDDHVQIRGWFIPGVAPGGGLTARRTIIVIHGAQQNRTDPAQGLLAFSAALATHGFAVLAFDMRGNGESPAAPFSLGYFEQRDALGAVDFLRYGPVPYPELGRPQVIGGWGVSMGAITLMLAMAREPEIRAGVSDSGYPADSPILEREVHKQGGLPPLFTPGALAAVRALYGIDFYAVRPGDVVGSIAPRPLFFIQGAADTYNPPSNLDVLVHDASVPGSQVTSWLVPGAAHAQAFHVAGNEYVRRVVAFFDDALGPDAGAGT